ncbi:MAG: hypothetical protein ACPLN0_06685 [Candidatus Hydrothermia bacterium]
MGNEDIINISKFLSKKKQSDKLQFLSVEGKVISLTEYLKAKERYNLNQNDVPSQDIASCEGNLASPNRSYPTQSNMTQNYHTFNQGVNKKSLTPGQIFLRGLMWILGLFLVSYLIAESNPELCHLPWIVLGISIFVFGMYILVRGRRDPVLYHSALYKITFVFMILVSFFVLALVEGMVVAADAWRDRNSRWFIF